MLPESGTSLTSPALLSQPSALPSREWREKDKKGLYKERAVLLPLSPAGWAEGWERGQG